MNLDDNELVGNLPQKLKAAGLAMCTAESCTGGLIAAVCTSLPGSSAWFNGGIVSYTDAMKERILQVPANVLAEHGAVSIPVVEYMAAGALAACLADCSVAVSGIAGPDGGSAEKPVGTVCIAAALKKTGGRTTLVNSKKFLFAGGREAIREAAAAAALNMLDKWLE